MSLIQDYNPDRSCVWEGPTCAFNFNFPALSGNISLYYGCFFFFNGLCGIHVGKCLYNLCLELFFFFFYFKLERLHVVIQIICFKLLLGNPANLIIKGC